MRERRHDLGAGRLDLGHLRADVGVARLVRDPRHHRLLRHVHVQAGRAVGAEVVVLEEVGDLLALEVVGDVLPEDLALDEIVRLPAERVRMLLDVVPAAAAGGHEDVRHAGRVEVVDDLGVGRRAEPAEDREHLVLQHELLGHLDRVDRVVAVVAHDHLQLAPVHAAVGVDVLEVGVDGARDLAVAGRGGTGEREVAANRDRGGGDAGGGRLGGATGGLAAPRSRFVAGTAGGERQRRAQHEQSLHCSFLLSGTRPRLSSPCRPCGAVSITPIRTAP